MQCGKCRKFRKCKIIVENNKTIPICKKCNKCLTHGGSLFDLFPFKF